VSVQKGIDLDFSVAANCQQLSTTAKLQQLKLQRREAALLPCQQPREHFQRFSSTTITAFPPYHVIPLIELTR
jgi:Leu/Phe-tRNA-protein transferase